MDIQKVLCKLREGDWYSFAQLTEDEKDSGMSRMQFSKVILTPWAEANNVAMPTLEEFHNAEKEVFREDALERRAVRYRNESDPLKNELEYDAFVKGENVNLTSWYELIAKIKSDIPLEVTYNGR